ncbi:hypothetical protein PHLCEN_2v10482 [Hermanssonia centrifuga]|uniref:Uncharacterized protein n=1 Tax=Hermanssonia centrifuga TaxID=98765 RepID=A0A2R6NME1_9APHY|nr:hypothetical protein PHLCEN_2v10482 [Hermanssonia centrifuga]
MSGPKKSSNSNVVLPGFQEAFAEPPKKGWIAQAILTHPINYRATKLLHVAFRCLWPLEQANLDIFLTDVPPSPPVSGRQTGHRCNSSPSATASRDTQPPSTSSPSQYRDSASASPVASSTRSDGDDEEFPELVGFQNLRRRKRHICPVCNKDFLRYLMLSPQSYHHDPLSLRL